MRAFRTPTRLAIRTATVVGVGFALAAWAVSTDLGRRAEFSTLDARIQLRTPFEHAAAQDLAVLTIRDDTDAAIGQNWPYPRSKHADAIHALVDAHAAAIVLDIQFLEPTTEVEDRALTSAIRDAVNAGVPVVLATASENGRVPVPFRGLDRRDGHPEGTRLRESGATYGLVDLDADADGVVRSVTSRFAARGGDELPSFVRAALDATDSTPAGLPSRSMLTWDAKAAGIDTHDYAAAVLDRSKVLRDLRGRTVFVGSTSMVLHDAVRTPVDEALPGVFLHAYAWLDARDGTSLHRVGPGWGLAISALLALGMALLGLTPIRGRIFTFGLLGLMVMGAWTVAAIFSLLDADIVLPVVAPLLATGSVVVAIVAMEARHALRDRRHVTSTFSRYLSPHVVRELLAKHEIDGAAGGTMREITVLFVDVRGYTSMSAGMPADELVFQLNECLEALVAGIDEHEGTVDKFLGDGLMAFFGAPAHQEDHAARACEAARTMLDGIDRLNQRRGLRGLQPIAIGIGIATGEAVVGNIGTARRLEYTAIGDPVNLAARLEGATKRLGVTVALAASTVAHAEGITTIPLGPIGIRGVPKPVEVSTLALNGEIDATAWWAA